MKLLRILAFPVSVIYGLVVFLYHLFYDLEIFQPKRFRVPVISIGNLTVGGTGKTPHIEYVTRFLLGSGDIALDRIASLSRGYGRATSGFLLADENSTAVEVGDEPRQIKQKFPNVFVAVDENRVHGIEKLLRTVPGLKVILLDDAFQHRRVKPGLSILLMDFQSVSKTQLMLPTGNLRESLSGAKRADIIIVTNSPKMLSPHERKRINKILNPKPHQTLYFSYVGYNDFVPVSNIPKHIMANKNFYFERKYAVLLVTGIADPLPLHEYYKQNSSELIHIQFSDHHEFTMEDIRKVQKKFDTIVNPNKIILTTEKDAMRLAIPGVVKAMQNLPVFYLPITIHFHDNDGAEFNRQIFDYVTKN